MAAKKIKIQKQSRAVTVAKPARKIANATSRPSPAESKIEALVKLMRRPTGATLAALMQTSGWQAHSVRGAISGAIKKKLGHGVISSREDGTRTYRIEA